MRSWARKAPRVTAHVLRFPRSVVDQDAPSLSNFIRQHLQARADLRLRALPDHLLGPSTDVSDAAIARVMSTHAPRLEKIERQLVALIEEMDREAQQ